MPFNNVLLLLLLICICFTSSLYANNLLNVPVQITASAVSHNRTTGINIFSGPVNITQGNEKHLEAATVTTKQTKEGKLAEITALGDARKKAHYWENKPQGKTLHAYANTIIYVPLNELITLKGSAFIQQGQNEFRGNLIYISLRDQTITAPKTANSRTTIIYQPN